MPSSPPSAPPHQQPIERPRASEMDLPPLTVDATAPYEWSELFDFTIDEQFLISLEDSSNQQQNPPPTPPELPPVAPPSRPQASDRVRKRDPRMVCSNFLAGRVPCACPEIDEKMEEAEGGPGKKRARTARSGGVARCQVPGCEADISQLKGYHRRHRVCLRCANATSVLLDGESKRYCQQCGKFHILLDFDEGKRSCRRKLERHNNRRRRKPNDVRGATENDAQGDFLCEDVSSDGEAGRGNVCSNSQITENEWELLQDSRDGNMSNQCSVPDSQNMQSDSVVTFVASGEAEGDRGTDELKSDPSPFYCNNKSSYSSMCPTGRISFKLYDWNPAEFPRRLRHQIFEWLASMPVELEGYIRPGCTILTAFISMPQFVWMKLLEDPASCLCEILAPGGMLWGRGTALIYLDNRIFQVLKDGTSVVKVKVSVGAPKLHYVYPFCFEAGKPVEFVACGSNLLQPKFRSLVSFAGKYLAHDYSAVFPHGKAVTEASVSFGHQWCKINVPYTEPDCFGPAFIEVENESGLSNFIPIFIGDKQVCSELKRIQQQYDAPFCRGKAQFGANDVLHDSCEVPCSTEMPFSDFILDVAWLLKQPPSERLQQVITSLQIQRFNCLLNFLISNESTFILERILCSLKIVIDEMESTAVTDGITDADWKLFQKYVGQARELLSQKLKPNECMVQNVENSVPKVSPSENTYIKNALSAASSDNLDVEMKAGRNMKLLECSTSKRRDETLPLLSGDVAMKVDDSREWPRKSYNLVALSRTINSRPLVYMLVAVAVCFGICAVFLHPYQVHKLAVTIRRCLFDDSS
ncbi:Squamosa promoter-binding-like protein [Ancistrocladus abbreviatus]